MVKRKNNDFKHRPPFKAYSLLFLLNQQDGVIYSLVPINTLTCVNERLTGIMSPSPFVAEGRGKPGAYPRRLRAQGGGHPGRGANSLQGTHTVHVLPLTLIHTLRALECHLHLHYITGVVATAEVPSAITTIQSAATFSSEQPIKYLFKTEGAGGQVGELYPPIGQVTYRVIQVADGQLEAQTDGTTAVSVVAGFPATTQPVTQAVFSQSEALEGDGTETHYTYYPATISDAGAGTMVTGVQASDTILSQGTPTGQLYVMMSPQEVLTGATQRSIAPRTQTCNTKSEAPRTSRDEKRRAQHNEVERRRRDKINNWIVQLSKTIPDCTLDATKTGQSKGGILSKACDYIQELRQSNNRLAEELGTLDRLRMDNQLLRQEVEDWKSKNLILRSQLRQHGIVAAASAEPQ